MSVDRESPGKESESLLKILWATQLLMYLTAILLNLSPIGPQIQLCRNLPYCFDLLRPTQINFLQNFLLCYLLFLHKRPMLITGNFNLHVDKCSDKSVPSFLDTCSTFGLKQHVREPTHRNGHALDLVLSSDVPVADLQVCPLTPSDHYFVSFQSQGTILPKSYTDAT